MVTGLRASLEPWKSVTLYCNIRGPKDDVHCGRVIVAVGFVKAAFSRFGQLFFVHVKLKSKLQEL